MSQPIVILKFGGSSQGPKGYPVIQRRIQELLGEGKRVVVVLSAIQNTTNLILESISRRVAALDDLQILHQAVAEKIGVGFPQERYEELVSYHRQYLEEIQLDPVQLKIRLISQGELLATTLLQRYLAQAGLAPRVVHATNLIEAEGKSDQIDPRTGFLWSRFRGSGDLLGEGDLILTQGFIARTQDRHLCLMGRSGSDTTASVLGATLSAQQVEIWTDVNGICTADPRLIPEAMLTPKISYSAAEELSSLGSYVIHPQAIQPCREARIPILIRNTFRPEAPSTVIQAAEPDTHPIHALSFQQGVTLLTIRMFDMSGPGFMAEMYRIFAKNQVAVDIVTSSGDEITTSTKEQHPKKLRAVQQELEKKGYRVAQRSNCCIVSIITDDAYSHPELPEAHQLLKLFPSEQHLITHYSSNRKSLSFVVCREIGVPLLRRLHHRYILKEDVQDDPDAWWRIRPQELIRTYHESKPESGMFIYSRDKVQEQITKLQSLTPVSRFFYAMKANPNGELLRQIEEAGLGFETVSSGELDHLQKLFPELPGERILFTPNYAPIEEYQKAFDAGAWVVLDNPNLLRDHPLIFSRRQIGIRIDGDEADGHDSKVMTEGEQVKFGLPISQLEEFLELAQEREIEIVGLHAHKGSGILNPEAWSQTAQKLFGLVKRFDLKPKWLNLGGGLGVTTNRKSLDLARMKKSLQDCAQEGIEFWLEPGRFLASEMGVLVTPVTQIRTKGQTHYLGVELGMNVLIRPMLYQAHHGIHPLEREGMVAEMRLSELEKSDRVTYQVVGPICESGDVLGKDRRLPEMHPGDLVLIEQAGAYGRVMSSAYNLRRMPREVWI